MPTNYIEIAPISSPPKKRKRTEKSTASPPSTVPVVFPPVVYPFMFPGYPAMPAQWMPVMPPPVFGLGSPLPQPQITQKPLGQCTVTKVPTESTDMKSPLQNLIAQVDAITPAVPKQPKMVAKKVATKELPSPPKKQEAAPTSPIVIQPVTQKRSKSARSVEIETTGNNTGMELRRKVAKQHTVLLHDLQALQKVNRNNEQVTKVCHDYSVDVSAIETQRGHALLVAIDAQNRQSIEFYYDQKRNELIEKTISTLTKLKSSVTVPAAWSTPTHGLPCLPYVTQNVPEKTSDEDSSTNTNKGSSTTSRRSAEDPYPILNQWYEDFRDCPYASPEDVIELSEKTGLTVSQVRKWLGNRRLRDKDNKVRLRKYDSKIILGHLRRRNKEKKEQMQQQQQQEQQQYSEEDLESSLNIKIESVASLV